VAGEKWQGEKDISSSLLQKFRICSTFHCFAEPNSNLLHTIFQISNSPQKSFSSSISNYPIFFPKKTLALSSLRQPHILSIILSFFLSLSTGLT